MTAATARLVLLGAIAALGSLAIQIIVPALPMLVDGIGATPEDGQLVIAVYLVGLAIGQLCWGAVSDHYGRRPILLAGAAIFFVGTLTCAVAGGLAVLLAGRVIQSLGAASSLVAARAMATDRAPIGKAAAPLAILTSVTLISPAIAPAVGGLVASFGGWRLLFWLLAGLTIVGGLLAWRTLPETHHGYRGPLHPLRLVRTYGGVIREAGFLPLALSNALTSGGFYLFLAVSPFVLVAAGATAAQAGFFYSAVACAIIAGTLSVPLILRRWPTRLKSAGSVVLAAGAAGLISLAWAGASLGGLFAAMALIGFGSGLSGPTLLAEAIERQRERASAVTSLFGTFQMAGAALLSTVIVRIAPSVDAELGLIGAMVILALVARHLASQTGS